MYTLFHTYLFTSSYIIKIFDYASHINYLHDLQFMDGIICEYDVVNSLEYVVLASLFA